MKRVTVLVNGPGEITGWAKPVCRELKKKGFFVILFILPCQFSNGREREIASKIEADEVHGPSSSLGTILNFRELEVDGILQLGGDLFFGRILSFLSKAPLLCYSYGYKKGMEKCSAVMTAYESMADKIRERTLKVEVVGDLVRDSIADTLSLQLEKKREKEIANILFLPGSRSFDLPEARHFLESLGNNIKDRLPKVKIRTLLPFYADDSDMAMWKKTGLCPERNSKELSFRASSLAVAPPGTNNIELMHCGIPAIIVLPFSFLRSVPVPGLKGFVLSMPLIGGMLKDHYLRKADRRTGYLGWPNRIAGREVQLELRGDITPGRVADEVVALLSDRQRLEKMREDLLAVSETSAKDPSLNICNILERLI
jgi:lipid-A-disaccharide synthase